MVDSRRLDVEALYTELRRTLRHGARASRLVRFTPELVELLLPSEANPDATIYERAIQAEGIVREALERIGGPEAEALSILLCLKPGTTGMTLEARRQRAGAVLGIQPGTMRRERHEGLLVWDLGMEVYGIVTGGDHQVS